MTELGKAMRARQSLRGMSDRPPQQVQHALDFLNILGRPDHPDRTQAAATHLAAMMDGVDWSEAVQVLGLAMVRLTREGGE